MHSKESGALWAMAHLKDPSIVADALESYRDGPSRDFAADSRLPPYKDVVGDTSRRFEPTGERRRIKLGLSRGPDET